MPRQPPKKQPRARSAGAPLPDPRHEKFARLVVQGKSKKEAALEIGITEQSASTMGWRLYKNVEIHRRIVELSQRLADVAVNKTVELADLQIATAVRRIHALDVRWRKLQQVIDERAADPSLANIPGGKTGLIVREIKSVGVGANAKLIPEFSVDTGMLREIRAHEEQAAKELGQWQGVKAEDADAPAVRPVVLIGLPNGEEEDARPLNGDALVAAGKHSLPVQ